ncbi:MAG: HAMP domain-containing sensor histidine kinase [Bacteroidota bacterium]
MNIQTKLSLTYITLLSIGVFVISTYAILSIRTFLLEEGVKKVQDDVQVFAESLAEDDDLNERVAFVARLTGYSIALFDSTGQLLLLSGDQEGGFVNADEFLNASVQSRLRSTPGSPVLINEEEVDRLIAFHQIRMEGSEARFLRISKLKSELYAAESSIRHIAYGAMISSFIVVILVSIFFARNLSEPIRGLSAAAKDITQGNLDRELNSNRSDEFGDLAKSLNQMAEKFKSDNEILKNLNEKQSQFFADITHEVRNPLHTIAGALEMIELDGLPQEKKDQYINTARKQLRRVENLFEDIKTLQRYDFDATFVNQEPVIMKELVEDAVNIHKPMVESKELELLVSVETDAVVRVDPDKMAQVLDNLITNAAKYTTEGSIWVTLREEGNHLEVKVRDTGIGIGEEHLSRLFDRFYRTDKARSRDKGGTGLGLSVVKSILKAHGAEIQVSSELGEGSEFWFNLPVVAPVSTDL